MAFRVLLLPENDHDWVHQNYVCLIVEETDWAVSLHNIFCRFLNIPPDFHQRNGDSRSSACYNVYGVDELTDIWNFHKKESTRPELTIYLQIFWKYGCIYFCDDWQWYSCRKFLLNSFFQLRDIQYSSKYRGTGVLGEEGLKLVWWYCASTRPTFESSVAVYNHTCLSRITTCFIWII